MDILSSSSKRIHESNLELYRSRLAGRLCIAIVCTIQMIARILTVSIQHVHGLPDILMLISIFFLLLMITVITVEYIFFKKIGPRVAKYSNTVDILLLLIFIGDWCMIIISTFNKIQHTDPPTFDLMASYGFTGFAWRALLVTLIIQNWKLKIVPPAIACILSTVYATVYAPEAAFLNTIRGLFQMIDIVLIIYCEDKIKWRMIWTNLHREKWVQVNNFILNNLPENIMILSFQGKTKFMSDHCKSFMGKYNFPPQNTQELFRKITELQQLKYEPEPDKSVLFRMQTERVTTQNELLAESGENHISALKIDALQDLIVNFKSIIQEQNLQERQFLVYNGKLKTEDNLQEKSIEIKISFVKHVEKEYVILLLRDTTQRDLLVALQETNKYKDQLLASVSHELRAPLNGNINLVEAAINSLKIPEDLKETLLIPALRSSKLLLHIINDILDMSQIKQKKLRLDFQSRNLKETLNNAAQLIELQAKMKGIELFIELDANLPMKFCTDHMRLNQIILNLLSNAIKFTNEGYVKLTASPMIENNWVRITVEDSGIGIRQENFGKLFSSYSTIEFDGRQAINSAGVGLGLNIASNLADLLAPKAHPGIIVSSIFGKGSVFSLIIENKQADPTQQLERLEEEPSDQQSLSKTSSYEIADEHPGMMMIPLPQIPKNSTCLDTSSSMIFSKPLELETLVVKSKCLCPKILIVDDNPFNIMAFETILHSLDIKCDSVYSGSACIEKLLCRQKRACGKHCKPYSVIFMDQEMPEMTGSETVVEIKRLQGENKIPEMKIIGCTAHKAKEEVEKFLESGLDSCIFKPICVDMIRDILKGVLVPD